MAIRVRHQRGGCVLQMTATKGFVEIFAPVNSQRTAVVKRFIYYNIVKCCSTPGAATSVYVLRYAIG